MDKINKYEEILKNENYALISLGMKKLISEDDGIPYKISYRFITQYNECNDKSKEMFNQLINIFTGYTFIDLFAKITGHKEFNRNLGESTHEQIYFLFTELLEDRYDDELSKDLLNFLSNCENNKDIEGFKIIDEFLINICGYCIKTILEYMQRKNDDLVVSIQRF